MRREDAGYESLDIEGHRRENRAESGVKVQRRANEEEVVVPKVVRPSAQCVGEGVR